MISKYYSFGNITLRLNLPEEVAGIKHYDDFYCDKKVPDFTVNFSYSDCLPLPEKRNAVFDLPDKVVEKGEKTYRCFYKNRGKDGFYAVREQNDDSSQINVVLDSSIKGQLWTRIILNTIGIEELAIKRGGVVFHSSFIEKDGKAVLFTGPCSIGKSTQAQLWHEHRGTPIINGDKTLIFIDNDTVYASGLPFSGSSGICKNAVMPLGCIVKLAKEKENTVRKLNSSEAFLAVLKSSYIPCGFVACAGEIAARISQKSKVYFLGCVPDKTAVEMLEKFIERE